MKALLFEKTRSNKVLFEKRIIEEPNIEEPNILIIKRSSRRRTKRNNFKTTKRIRNINNKTIKRTRKYK